MRIRWVTTAVLTAGATVSIAAATAGSSPRAGLWRLTTTPIEIRLPGVSQAAVQKFLGVPRVSDICVAETSRDTFYRPHLAAGCKIERNESAPGVVVVSGQCPDGRVVLKSRIQPDKVDGIADKSGGDGTYLKSMMSFRRIGDCRDDRARR